MENVENAVGYARVSTKDQDIEVQIKQFKDLGIPPERIFFDVGVSGIVAAEKRKGYRQMLNYIAKNKVTAIYCFEISRLGRTAMDTLNLVMDWEKEGVQIISLSPTESWSKNTDPAFRGILIHLLAWMYEMERKSLKERVKIGIEQYTEKHGRWGRKPLEPNQKKVEKMMAEGKKPAQIARDMNIPPSTLYTWLKRWEREADVESMERI